MKWTVGAKIAAGFSLTLAVFVLVGITSYRGTSQLEATTEARRQTFQLLAARDGLMSMTRAAGQMLRTYIITGAGEDLQEFRTYATQAQEALQVVQKLQSSDLKQLESLAMLFKDHLATSWRLAETRRENGLAAATELLVSEQTKQALGAFFTRLEDVGQAEEVLLKEQIERSLKDADHARWIILLGTAAALVLAGVAGLLITRDISIPLRQLTLAAERITVGDLGVALSNQDRSDEIGVLARSLQRMTLSLQRMASTAELIAAGDLRATVEPLSSADVVGNAFAKMSHDLRLQIKQLMEGAGVLGSAANEIAGSTSQLAASASQSAAAVSETTTTVEEVRQTAQLASEKARNVSESAQKAVQVSESGRTATTTVEAGISRIRLQMEAIASSMMRLSEQGQAIGQIIATVEDLSVQSNLLAVNAAIEAAKAGEHGRGFSVVAQEVKGLAEQSRQATNQVRSILGDIQRATSEAVMATEEGAKAVDAGVRQTELAGGAIQVMSASVNDAAQAAMQIAASSQQQLIGMDQVANAMGSIKQASVQNLDSASKLEDAARSISDLGQKLRSLIERYRV